MIRKNRGRLRTKSTNTTKPPKVGQNAHSHAITSLSYGNASYTTSKSNLHSTSSSSLRRVIRSSKPLTRASTVSSRRSIRFFTSSSDSTSDLHNPLSSLSSQPPKSFTDVHRDPNYITNPIFYVNGEPHIGHLYTMLVTDTISRWKQVQGHPVYVMSGTDEHGIKVQEASINAGYTSPQKYCDDISQKFQTAWDLFDVNAQSFLRTTSDDHKATVQQLWRQLARNGYIHLGKHEGWYCKSDEAFIPESQLVKQPDGSFTTTLGQSVIWLSEENFKFHIKPFIKPLLQWYKQNPLSIQPESQYNNVIGLLESEGLDDVSVSRLSSKLSWGIDVPDDCEYCDPATKTMKKGSEITTSKHKVYVWLDALAIYLSGAKQARRELEQSGRASFASSYDNDRANTPAAAASSSPSTSEIRQLIDSLVKSNSPYDYTPQEQLRIHHPQPSSSPSTIKQYNIYHETQWMEHNPIQKAHQHYADDMMDQMAPFWPPSIQLLGKDIVKFHAIYWPAFLMGAGLPLPRQLISHCHWLVNDQKMSKSLGNVLSPLYLSEKYGMENTKYALIKTSQLGSDGNFNETAVLNLINADLSDNLGNLSMRVTSKNILMNGVYPDPFRSSRVGVSLKSDTFDHTSPQWLDLDRLDDDIKPLITPKEIQLHQHITQLQHDFKSNMDTLRFDRALDAVVELGRACNVYFTEYEPWVLAKRIRDGETHLQPQLDVVNYHCIEVIRICSIYLQIITPKAAASLLNQLSVPHDQRSFHHAQFGWRPSTITSITNSTQGPSYLTIDGVDVPRDEVNWESIHGRAQVQTVPFNKIILQSNKKLKGDEQRKAQEDARKLKQQRRDEQRMKQQQRQKEQQREQAKEMVM